jgi:type I restriction enzyme R subunit
MSNVGQPERKAQNRLVKLFQDQLDYTYLGDWQDRQDNSHVEEQYLRAYLTERGYDDIVISRAIHELKTRATVGGARKLYEANRDVYELLRYGAKVKREAGDQYETVHLIDWDNAKKNHFAIAEEVSIKGPHNKRPDVVLYVNGIALGVIELKRSKTSASEGIRQNIGNQNEHFIRPFFSTVQYLFAGNDVDGLRYGVIQTPEKYWLTWKEPSPVEEPLDRGLIQMCNKERFLELIHDFIVFDAGVKKAPRHNQFFGVKAAQERIAKREGGIIWHTQGSGKSLTMVWLAKWIHENQENARVLVITDRTELDEQIESVFGGVDESIYRTTSGADLIGKLNSHNPWLICSLVHKFRGGDDDKDLDEASDDFIAQLNKTLPPDFSAKGNIFVFVDEAHRTQSGKMHAAMKDLLPGAMFIGFTGTPLLKTDKATTIATFGTYIHTYKFDEAVEDGVVLDLRYEARDVEQDLSSAAAIDKWFDAKTKALTDLTKATLKRRWGTMQRVFSSEGRTKQIVQDILLDMETKPRLMDGRGNAILVSDSIYQACRFYDLFVQYGFKDKVAIVTSYVPSASEISKEDAGDGKTEKIRQYEIYRQMLSDFFGVPADDAVARIDDFEKEVKRRFVEEPGQMRLLIVVDKLLTGFDAPDATFLYIDKKMQDHGLFQAICRVNRLGSDDKEYGYIVDYRDLFKSLEGAISDYTSDAFEGYDDEDIEGLLKNRLEDARKDLDEALEFLRLLCEPVAPPKGTLQYQHYFCAKDAGDAEQLKANEPLRVELYKGVASLVRAYTTIANEMAAAGYSDADAASIKDEAKHYADVRDEVKLGANENVDLKQFEAGMRALLDNYIQAKPPEMVATFEEKGLVQLIVDQGEGALGDLPDGIKKDKDAVAETIINNVRKTIVDEQAMNPKYYDKMSELLSALILQRKQDAIDYKAYLEGLLNIAKQVGMGESDDATYPEWVKDGAQRALIDSGLSSDVASVLDETVRRERLHDWVGNKMKERALAKAIRAALPAEVDDHEFEKLFNLIKARHEYQ